MFFLTILDPLKCIYVPTVIQISVNSVIAYIDTNFDWIPNYTINKPTCYLG